MMMQYDNYISDLNYTEIDEVNKVIDEVLGSETFPKKSARKSPGGMTGWICPVCGRGLSPYTSVCPCRGSVKMEVTC